MVEVNVLDEIIEERVAETILLEEYYKPDFKEHLTVIETRTKKPQFLSLIRCDDVIHEISGSMQSNDDIKLKSLMSVHARSEYKPE